jgi:hypothetical protein
VRFDSGSSRRENLKAVRDRGWTFLIQRKVHRLVDVGRSGARPVGAAAIATSGTGTHRPGFGSVRLFQGVSRDGDLESGAPTELGRDEWTRLAQAEPCWAIGDAPRG